MNWPIAIIIIISIVVVLAIIFVLLVLLVAPLRRKIFPHELKNDEETKKEKRKKSELITTQLKLNDLKSEIKDLKEQEERVRNLLEED